MELQSTLDRPALWDVGMPHLLLQADTVFYTMKVCINPVSASDKALFN